MRLEYFQLIDRVVDINLTERRISCEATVPSVSTVFEGHFPGFPLMPGVLLIEAMAQTSGWLVIALTKFERMPFLASVKEAKLRRFVDPGQTLDLTATVAHEGSGYAVRERRDGEGVMLAAKKGGANRLGYICAHAALIIICFGGLLDSELPLRLQILLGGKQPVVDNMLIADVPASGRLARGNPSFRASMMVPEGGRSSQAVVMVDDGALVQRMTSPKHHVAKTYEATLDGPVTAAMVEAFARGVPLREGAEEVLTRPATLRDLGQHRAEVTVEEGRYHQVRRMFAAHGLHVTALHRTRFGPWSLGALQPGAWVAAPR